MTVGRPNNWDISLAKYLDDIRSAPFCWDSHCCLKFTNDCVKIVRGFGFADDWIGGYKTGVAARKHYKTLLVKQGHKSIIQAMDARLERVDTAFPVRGTVVGRPQSEARGVTPIALGIVASDCAAFIGEQGLLLSPIEASDYLWSVD